MRLNPCNQRFVQFWNLLLIFHIKVEHGLQGWDHNPFTRLFFLIIGNHSSIDQMPEAGKYTQAKIWGKLPFPCNLDRRQNPLPSYSLQVKLLHFSCKQILSLAPAWLFVAQAHALIGSSHSWPAQAPKVQHTDPWHNPTQRLIFLSLSPHK